MISECFDSGDDKDKYAFVRDSDKPDRDVEYFWYLFKVAVVKLGKDEGLGESFLHLPEDILPTEFLMTRPSIASQIDHISTHLNELQRKEEYAAIQTVIVEVFEDLTTALLKKGSPSKVAVGRLLTFAKRWDEWAEPEFAMRQSSCYVALLHICLVGFRCTKDQRGFALSCVVQSCAIPGRVHGSSF